MGGDHGHGHHAPMCKIPDWRIYKVESSPELMEVKRLLAQKGLKDPWLRNEVWRYDRSQFAHPTQNWRRVFMRGFWPGLGLTVLTIALESLWAKAHPSEHGHGHH
ncbi:NADH dehydrogenase [ubiquinone] 1 beta subcomplex subunit 3 [Bacillus rossius redtenbacheri]|uniref:NADH dehydrogenase [ubiquinone] 1 beta subcomplex subunit 3 n=1 Tax=Bacillus rossius redtenbacheri TaxID=93214 RepID=UPI002FDE9135